MRKHKVIKLSAFTKNGLIEKVEPYCDNLESKGQFEVLSVSFTYNNYAFITIRTKE